MARSKRAAPAPKTDGGRKPGPGDNSGALSDDDFDALVLYHERKLGAGIVEVELAMATLKAKRQAVNDRYKLLNADLHYTRKDFEAYLDRKRQAEEDPEAYVAAQEKLRRLDVAGGLPVGAQMELLLPTTGDTADDKARAFAFGRRAYFAFKECTPTPEIDPLFHQDWIAGWQDGQSETVQKMGRAEAILAERSKTPPAGQLGPADAEEGEGDEGQDVGDEIEDVAAQAARLKDSGWTEPTAEEASFAEDRTPEAVH